MLVLRWVDDNLFVHEDFIGLYEVPNIQSSTLVGVVKDVFLRLNLSFAKVRGQCYDGASNMSGTRSGVAKQILDMQPKALFTHCYGHSLNLAVSDTFKKCKTMKKALDITHEITKLVKYSPRRENLFNDLKGEMAPGSPGIRVLCPTRWTVRAESMRSIINNYHVLQELWDQAAEIVHDSETVARIRGVAAQMQSFDFFWGLVLGECLLRNTDNLSKTLQKDFSASEGYLVAQQTKQTIMLMRNDESYDIFCKKVLALASADEIDIAEPVLPRKRRAPSRFEDGNASPEFHSSPRDMYRQVYYEAIDLLVQTIGDRFDQHGYNVYSCLEQLLLRAIQKKDYSKEFQVVIDVYDTDLTAINLKTHLDVLSSSIPGDKKITNIFDVKNYLQGLTRAERDLISEVIVVMKLILVMPATNSSSERSFSAMRRIKTYLRTTMKQERLNSLMVLHVHKDYTDKLHLLDIANDFVSNSNRRKQVFGTFI